MSEFQGPQQDPGMERRLLIVFALTFVILLAFQPVLMKYLGKNQPAPQPQQQQQQQQAAPAKPTAPAPAPITAPAGTKAATAEQDIVIESSLYRVTLTNKGAQVKSWVLKKYDDDKGHPLDLVNKIAAEKYGNPMSLWTYDEGLRNKLNSALYVISSNMGVTEDARRRGARPSESQPPEIQPGSHAVLGHDAALELTLEYADADTVVRKVFRFEDSYVVKVESSVVQKGQTALAYLAWPGGFGDQTVPASYAAAKVEHQYGDKTERMEVKKVSGGATVKGPFNWAGVADQYFGAVFLPDDPDAAAMVTLHNEIAIPKNLDQPDPNQMMNVPVLGAAVGNGTGVTNGRWFIGPKAVDVIDSIRSTPAKGQGVAPNLGGMVDFGFFGIIAKPLFLWLKWTQQHWIANWGWAICILTVIINLALLPLRITSMKSALKMQRVQPQINAIKKKYEKFSMKDPRKAEMNKEIAAVFKEHGVNPAGGCLPMLIQLPFLWAFYTMLSAAIELRHAPWLWIKDLSSPDPYHILPVVIVISTWLMQKWTPNTGMDPAQQKMMNLMMPIMLGFFSWAVAAGLGVYWLIGTVIAVIQQWIMNRTALGQEMREIAEKRARKKKVATT